MLGDLLEEHREKKHKLFQENFWVMRSNFKQIFKTIVKTGWAELRLVKRAPARSQDTDQSSGLAFVDHDYERIKVEVSFTETVQEKERKKKGSDLVGGDEGEEGLDISRDEPMVIIEEGQDAETGSAWPLANLSGGQKAVVAACLIFAIQEIDSSPFYILDEFDGALDPDYCQGIADQIKKMSQPSQDPTTGKTVPGCQFIMTTFKSHMISCAEKIFEVQFKG